MAKALLNNPNTPVEKKESGDLKKLLEEKGYILGDDIDECDYLKFFHQISYLQNKHLGLTIVPTLGCNFSCVYCYETGKVRSMNKKTEDSLFRFVKNRIQR